MIETSVVETDETCADFAELKRVRYEVLRRPLGMQATDPHPLDVPGRGFHVVAKQKQQQQMVGTASFAFFFHDDDGASAEEKPTTGRLYQMAVVSSAQRCGVGRQLVERVLSEARARGCSQVVLHARFYAVDFYKKLGFTECGPRFQEIGMEHAEMRLALR